MEKIYGFINWGGKQEAEPDDEEYFFPHDIKTIVPRTNIKPRNYDYEKENIWKFPCKEQRKEYLQDNFTYGQLENYYFSDKSGKSYYDYKKSSISYGDYGTAKNYKYGKQIGSGHYAEVYKSIENTTNSTVIIKNLNDIKVDKIMREYMILKYLKPEKTIVQLLDIFPLYNKTRKDGLPFHKLAFQQEKDDYEGDIYKQMNETSRKHRTARAGYVYDFFTTTTMHKAEKYMLDMDIRCAIYDLLKALGYTHKMGIMHRDVKPGNILYHMHQKKSVLIDFGLADFFIFKKPYHYRVGTKTYKAPELLLNYTCYDFNIDTWGAGVAMAQLVFRKRPFFYGSEDVNVLKSIVKLHGTEKFVKLIKKYDLMPDEYTAIHFPNELFPRKWDYYVNNENKGNVSPEATDLLSKLLALDFADRISPEDALAHPYFDPVRDFKEGRNTTEINFADDDEFSDDFKTDEEPVSSESLEKSMISGLYKSIDQLETQKIEKKKKKGSDNADEEGGGGNNEDISDKDKEQQSKQYYNNLENDEKQELIKQYSDYKKKNGTPTIGRSKDKKSQFKQNQEKLKKEKEKQKKKNKKDKKEDL